MEKTVNYKGFDIHLRSAQTASGKCWGRYHITAASEYASKVFAAYSISGFGSEKIHETSDDRATNPSMLSIEHLLSMAKHEIDIALVSLAKPA